MGRSIYESVIAAETVAVINQSHGTNWLLGFCASLLYNVFSALDFDRVGSNTTSLD